MVSALDVRVGEGTRGLIIEELAVAPRTARDLAKTLGIQESAARGHLERDADWSAWLASVYRVFGSPGGDRRIDVEFARDARGFVLLQVRPALFPLLRFLCYSAPEFTSLSLNRFVIPGRNSAGGHHFHGASIGGGSS